MKQNKELRQDLVSGDWVLIASGRGKRPFQFKEEKFIKPSKKNCIFENPEKAGGGGVIRSYPETGPWQLQIVPNKYPAITHESKASLRSKKRGPFLTIPGYGYHELLITRDHDKNFPKLTKKNAGFVFKAFQERYQDLAKDKKLANISIYHNWGPKTGASIYHPHYQMIAIPVIPPDVHRSLMGSGEFSKKHGSCVHCMQIDWERKEKKRIIYENEGAIVFAPFVSKEPFEMRVFNKQHLPYFEDLDEENLMYAVDALQTALEKLEKAINNAQYNFFIHTSPLKNKEKYEHYHWHIEIVPRLNISAGFELSTAVEINPMDPDDAAKLLRNTR